MAHSFIYTVNSNTDRSVTIPDSALYIYMYFFNEVSQSYLKHNSRENEIFEQYEVEILEVHTSYMDAMLQEVYDDPELKSWYLSMLSLVDDRFDSFGEYIDHNYLNQIQKADKYTRPIEVSLFKDLITDIYWVLRERESPSGRFKWFEEDVKAM